MGDLAAEALEGLAEGVDEQGALRLVTQEDGQELHCIVSGEVSVRLGDA